jgi:hypothetical protein
MKRKQFIQTTALAAASVFVNKLLGAGYTSSAVHSSANVTYYKKNQPEFDLHRRGFNKRIVNTPTMIALVQNAEGVQEAIALAKSLGQRITVKSGGHCMESFHTADGCMQINLSQLNTIAVQGNKATIGPSCTLKKIYETIIPQGKYLPGGSCQSVAISGLTLGGGYGLLSRQYGLTCDSLLEAEIATTTGEIITTTYKPDLLWALRGGGNANFGVVTKLTYKLHTAPKQMQSHKFRHEKVSIEKAIDICKLWFQKAQQLPRSCFSAFIYNGRTTYILLTNVAAQNDITNDFINTFKAQSTKVTEGKQLPLGQALKAYYAEANPITFKNASAGLYKSFDDIKNILPQVFEKVKSRPGILYQINTLGGAIQNAEFETGSSFAHRNYNFFSELQAYWESASANAKFLSTFQEIQSIFINHGITAQYRNYPDVNFLQWDRYYYGKNLERLITLKKQLDPGGIMGGLQVL